jgi:hypothetical protein
MICTDQDRCTDQFDRESDHPVVGQVILWVCDVIPAYCIVYCARDESSYIMACDLICAFVGLVVGTQSYEDRKRTSVMTTQIVW